MLLAALLPCILPPLPPPPSLQASLQPTEAVLSQQRFHQLDMLLNRAGMYTQFLTEQMKSYHDKGSSQQEDEQQQQQEEAAVEAGALAASGQAKRKRGGRAPASKKKAKTDMAAAAAKGEAAAQAAKGAISGAGTLAEKQKVGGASPCPTWLATLSCCLVVGRALLACTPCRRLRTGACLYAHTEHPLVPLPLAAECVCLCCCCCCCCRRCCR